MFISPITLTKTQLNHGLTSGDFTEFAGYRIPFLYLSEFPYWPELRDGLPLTPEMLWERANAIFDKMEELGVADHFGRTEFSFEDADALAPVAFSTLRRRTNRTADDPWDVVKCGVGHYTDRVLHNTRTTIAHAGIVMHQDRTEQVQRVWAQKLRMHKDMLHHFPNDPSVFTLIELHELGHTKQKIACFYNPIISFYNELHADLFAEGSAERSGVDPQVLLARRCSRYIELIVCSAPEYWFAKTLEDVKAGKTPLSFIETFDAVMMLRIRLAMHLTDSPDKNLDSQILQSALLEWDRRASAFMPYEQTQRLINQIVSVASILDATNQDDPRRLFSTLNKIVRNEQLLPIQSREIGKKIVHAASYFNPDLIQDAPYRPAGIRREDPKMTFES